jgi:hypothetical protein
VKRWRRVEKRNYSDIERGRQHFSESFFLELVTSGVIGRLFAQGGAYWQVAYRR